MYLSVHAIKTILGIVVGLILVAAWIYTRFFEE